MNTIVSLYSIKKDEIKKFLSSFFGKEICLKNPLHWSMGYENPVAMADIIGTFIDNNNKFQINMWISLDKGYYINVTDQNADNIIRYLFERYPY